jgi:lysophospholipase L1-like esterase
MGSKGSSESPERKCSENLHIVLLGDSTLDNLVWVDSQEETVKAALQRRLPGARVTNFAADGFTSSDVLKGQTPSISGRARDQAKDPFPEGWNSKGFRPLEHLATLKDVTHIVLSIGGNDIREILGNMKRLPASMERLITNYQAILATCLKVCPNVIVQMQYRPALHMDTHYHVYGSMARIPGPGSPVDKINELMKTVYKPIFPLVIASKLAVLDMASSFPLEDSSFYKLQIEPSAKGGELIATLISHAVQHHEWSKESVLYSKKGLSGDVKAAPIPLDFVWSVL